VSARAFRVLVGALAIAVPGLFVISFGGLQKTCDYPAILGRPAAEVFAVVTRGGPAVVALWTGTLVASVLFVAMVAGLHRLLSAPRAPYLGIATAFGVLAALAQMLDLAQWVFLVPRLAAQHATTNGTDRAAIAAVYEGFHALVGDGIGLYLATVLNGLWAVPAGFAMRDSPLWKPWLGWGGIASGLLFLASAVPGIGLQAWFLLNTVGFGVWGLWLAATGLVLVFRRGSPSSLGGAEA
jgi:hypothetical protein